MAVENEDEAIFKIVVIGDKGVGKTTLVRAMVSSLDRSKMSELPAEVEPTIGVDFFSVILKQVRPGLNVRLQLFDTAGAAAYAPDFPTLFRGTTCVLCVYSSVDSVTFESLINVHIPRAQRLCEGLPQDRFIVVASKQDVYALQSNAAGMLTIEDVESRLRDVLPEVSFLALAATDEAQVSTTIRDVADCIVEATDIVNKRPAARSPAIALRQTSVAAPVTSPERPSGSFEEEPDVGGSPSDEHEASKASIGSENDYSPKEDVEVTQERPPTHPALRPLRGTAEELDSAHRGDTDKVHKKGCACCTVS